MPTYSFRDNETGEVNDHTLRISELDQFKVDNPHLSLVHLTTPVHVRGINQKPDTGFRDVLSSIKKANRGSTINDW